MANGRVLDVILDMSKRANAVGPVVLSEAKSISSELARCRSSGLIQFTPGLEIGFGEFEDIRRDLKLGSGEVECLLLARKHGWTVCCDDRRARKIISAQIGGERVTGTLGLLCQACRMSLMTLEAAYTAYEAMRAAGGFLPAISRQEFEAFL